MTTTHFSQKTPDDSAETTPRVLEGKALTVFVVAVAVFFAAYMLLVYVFTGGQDIGYLASAAIVLLSIPIGILLNRIRAPRVAGSSK